MATDSLMRDNIVHVEFGKRMNDYHATGFYWDLAENILRAEIIRVITLPTWTWYCIKNDKKIFFEARRITAMFR